VDRTVQVTSDANLLFLT